jgi:hypothetical protein
MDLNIVMEARERSLALHTITSSWFDAAPLDSPQSTSLQSSHGRLAAIQREEAEERDTAPDPLALVLATLQRIESGDIDAFVALNEHLARDLVASRRPACHPGLGPPRPCGSRPGCGGRRTLPRRPRSNT